VLVFGGTGNPGAEAAGVGQTWLGDTWSWDGRIWIQLADTGPSARQAPAMAGDPVRSRVTLFSGGQLGQGRQAVADTWEWDGARWLEVADTGPSPRLAPSMAFDAGTNKLILFGGIGVEAGPAAAPSDTWAWDGHLWTQVADTGPSARLGHAMATVDSSIVLFGGQVARPDGASGVSLGDTWAWTAGVWRQTQDIGPGPRSSHAMDYVVADSSASITLFGGQGSGALQDTWRLVSRA
jgi:hypothetical protein